MSRLKREIWKTHPVYTDYVVSNWGRVKSFKQDKNGRFLKIYEDEYGYLRVWMYKKNVKEIKRIHKAVLETFIGPCPKGKECNHKDGIKTNNFVSNLEWVSPKENVIHAYSNNLKNKGEQHCHAKLKELEVLQIRELLKEGNITLKAISKMFNVCPTRISSIRDNKTWKHLK